MDINFYNQTVKEYSNRICRFVDKLLLNSEVAKDITQDVFLKLWENLDKIDHSKVKSWLFTTAYHASIDYAKKAKRFQNEEFIPEKTIEPVSSDLKKIVMDALDLLNDSQRTIVLLRDYEGYSYEEIGEILGLNESQVKVYLFRARKVVKDYIGDLRLVL